MPPTFIDDHVPNPCQWPCPQPSSMTMSPTLINDHVPNPRQWPCPQPLSMTMSPTLVYIYVNNNVQTLVNVHVILSSHSHRQFPCHPLLTLTNYVPTLINDDAPTLTYDDVLTLINDSVLALFHDNFPTLIYDNVPALTNNVPTQRLCPTFHLWQSPNSHQWQCPNLVQVTKSPTWKYVFKL